MAAENPRYRASSSSAKLDQVQGQVNEVKDIMSDSINKVVKRGDRLDDLISRTDDLQASAAENLRYRASSASAKLDQVQGQVNEVKDIMSDNSNKVVERGDQMDEPIGRPGDRQASAAVNHPYRASSSTAKRAQVQGQVNEVKVILSDSINKVVEIGGRPDDLISRADNLQAYATSFRRTNTRVARKCSWENIKMKIIISVIVLIVLILIILIIVFATNTVKKTSPEPGPSPPASTTDLEP